jgi:glycosyltransferase involved in cell wall biosynthesis
VFDAYGLERRFDLVLRAPPGLRLTKNLLYPAQVAREMARRPPPDLLYGRHAYALACAAIAADRGAGPPFAYEAHALPMRWLRRAAEAWLFRRPRFSLLVAISRALAEDYGARFPALAGRKVLVAHDGADPVAAAEPARPAPAPWPGRAGAPQLGYVGHLYPGKGMETVAALATLLPECDVHAVGGTERDLACKIHEDGRRLRRRRPGSRTGCEGTHDRCRPGGQLSDADCGAWGCGSEGSAGASAPVVS